MPQPRIDADHARYRGRLLPINCSLEVCHRLAYRQATAETYAGPLTRSIIETDLAYNRKIAGVRKPLGKAFESSRELGR